MVIEEVIVLFSEMFPKMSIMSELSAIWTLLITHKRSLQSEGTSAGT